MEGFAQARAATHWAVVAAPGLRGYYVLCLMMVGNGIRPQVVSAQQPKPVVRQEWASPNLQCGVGGAVSADGRYLSFDDRLTGDLVVRDLVNGTERRLTNNGGVIEGYADDSVISPDGSQVAVRWHTIKDAKHDVRIFSAAGTGAPRIDAQFAF